MILGRPIGVAQAMARQRRKQQQHVLSNSMDCGVEWASALLLCALHDRWRFGRRRFAKMAASWTARMEDTTLPQGFAIQWRNELEDTCGLNRSRLEQFAAKLEKCITGGRCDFKTKAKTRDMLAGMVVTVCYELYKNYGFRAKRIQALQQKIMDMAYVVSKGDVPIYEFMECLYEECNLEFITLRRYCEMHERPKIYG